MSEDIFDKACRDALRTQVVADVGAMRKRIAELEAALQPFADAYHGGGDFYSMADRIDGTHFLRAAEVLKQQK